MAANSVTPMMAQYLEIKQDHPGWVWTPRIRFGGLLDVPDDQGETRTQGPVSGMGVALLAPGSPEPGAAPVPSPPRPYGQGGSFACTALGCAATRRSVAPRPGAQSRRDQALGCAATRRSAAPQPGAQLRRNQAATSARWAACSGTLSVPRRLVDP